MEISIIISAFVIFIVAIYFFSRKKINYSIFKKDEKFSNKNNQTDKKPMLKNENEFTTIIQDLQTRIESTELLLKEVKSKNKKLEESYNQLLLEKLELEKQVAKLEGLSKKKEEIFAIYLHDIKNPAGAIKNLVDLLDNYEISINEQKIIIISLLNSANKILKLTSEISKIVHEGIEETKLNLEECDFNEIIIKIVSVNTVKARTKNIQLDLTKNEIPKIKCDPDKIETVIDNLIDNAIKFSEPNTKIKVSADVIESKLRVEITDSGPGLSVEELKDAFQKGVMLSAKPTAGESSSGLGLWIVKKIIEEHNGKIIVTSKKGKGSTFSFEIPAFSS